MSLWRRDKASRAVPNRVILAVLAVTLLALAGAGDYLYAQTQTPSPQGPPGAHLTPLNVGLGNSTWANCIVVSTCTTTAISVIAFSTILVVMGEDSGTNPTSVTAHTGVLTQQRGKSSSTVVETAVYATKNLSANDAAYTVTIAFAATHTYTIGVYELKHTTISSVDVIGAGSSSAGSTQASDTGTTTIANDLVFLAAVTAVNTTSTATGGDAVVNTQHVGAVTTSLLNQLDASTGSFTEATNWGTSVRWVAISIALIPALAPIAPTSLTAGSVTMTTVPLTWNHGAGTGPITNATVDRAIYSGGSCGAYSTHYSAGPVRTYTVTGLVSGTAYCFTVDWWNLTTEGAVSNVVSDVQTANVPPVATGLTANPQSGTTDTIVWSWTIPAQDTGVTNETLLTNSACHTLWGQFATFVSMGNGATLTYVQSGLAAGTTYNGAIVLWNATGASLVSSCASATTNALPTVVTALGSTGATQTTVGLTWTNPAGSLINSSIDYIPTASGLCSAAGTTTVNIGSVVSSYTVTGLAPNTRYCFDVHAWTAGGKSPEMGGPAWLNVTTPNGLPGQITQLNMTSRTTTTIALKWVLPGGAAVVNVTMRYGTTCGTWTQVSDGGAFTTGTITGLVASTHYCLATTAWSSAGEGPLSQFINVTTLDPLPGVPTNLHSPTASQHTITVAWTNPVAVNINDTVAYATPTCGSSFALASTGGATTSYQISGLVAFTNYCIKVEAWTNSGTGGFSSTVNVVSQNPTPPAPLHLSVTSVGTTWMTLTWSNPANYTLYNNSVYAKSTSCGPSWPIVVSTNGVASAWNLTGLTPSTLYCITVTAWDGESNHSAPLNATTLGSGGGGAVIGGGIGAAVMVLALFLGLFAVIATLAGKAFDRRRS